MVKRAACLFALASVVGCAANGQPADAEARFDAPLASVVFGDDGLTPPLSVPAFRGASLTLHARTDPGTCFAIASLEDAEGHAWVRDREAGPYCTDCEVRTSIAKEEGLFVLSGDDGFAPERGLTVRFGLVRCDTLTPLRSGSGQNLELSWLPRDEVPERGRLSVRFLVSEHSMLHGRPDLQRALVAHVNEELAATGIEVTLDDVTALVDVPRESSFSTTALAELEALFDGVPSAPNTVDVAFAGCLRYDDVLGPPTAVDGFTPRVVGGAGPASAVFMPGRRCDGFADAPANFPLDGYAHTLAHELGHFLGLYHVVETDGTTDLLSDTSEANVMHPNPSLAIARGFTPSQARIMRAHPWVRRPELERGTLVP